MANYFEVASLEQLPPGAGTVVTIEGKDIALFNVDGIIYAMPLLIWSPAPIQPCYPMDTCQFCQYLSGGGTHSLFALRCCVLWHRSPFASPWPKPAQQRLSLRLRSGHGRKWPKYFPARRKEVARRSRFRRQGNEPAS